jgi:hypothetical protein
MDIDIANIIINWHFFALGMPSQIGVAGNMWQDHVKELLRAKESVVQPSPYAAIASKAVHSPVATAGDNALRRKRSITQMVNGSSNGDTGSI